MNRKFYLIVFELRDGLDIQMATEVLQPFGFQLLPGVRPALIDGIVGMAEYVQQNIEELAFAINKIGLATRARSLTCEEAASMGFVVPEEGSEVAEGGVQQ